MEAVIKTGGHQFRVKKGDKLYVNKLELADNAEIQFDTLCITDGANIKIGQPLVQGASVVGKVLKQLRGDKVIARTYKRRKGFHKKTGHRQELTQIEITSIKG